MRKYKPVRLVESIEDFEKSSAIWFEMVNGHNKRMWHRAALESLQYRCLKNFIEHHYLYICEKVANSPIKMAEKDNIHE